MCAKSCALGGVFVGHPVVHHSGVPPLSPPVAQVPFFDRLAISFAAAALGGHSYEHFDSEAIRATSDRSF